MMLALALFALPAASPSAQEPNPCGSIIQNVWDPRFTPGQHWSYHSRPVDAGSTLIVTKIDDVPGIGLVLQIDVDHADFYDRTPATSDPERLFHHFDIQHIAIRRDSLDASVVENLGVVTLPAVDYRIYESWQKDCVAKTYGSTVADTLTTLGAQFCVQASNKNRIPACTPDPHPVVPPRPRPAPSNP